MRRALLAAGVAACLGCGPLQKTPYFQEHPAAESELVRVVEGRRCPGPALPETAFDAARAAYERLQMNGAYVVPVLDAAAWLRVSEEVEPGEGANEATLAARLLCELSSKGIPVGHAVRPRSWEILALIPLNGRPSALPTVQARGGEWYAVWLGGVASRPFEEAVEEGARRFYAQELVRGHWIPKLAPHTHIYEPKVLVKKKDEPAAQP